MYCVNDGAVMAAWAESQGVEGSMITFLADTRSELTRALGVVLAALAVLFYVITVAKLGPNLFNRPM